MEQRCSERFARFNKSLSLDESKDIDQRKGNLNKFIYNIKNFRVFKSRLVLMYNDAKQTMRQSYSMNGRMS